MRLAPILAALVLAASGLRAQQVDSIQRMRVEQLQPGLVLISGYDNGNILAVGGDSGVVLVDAQTLARAPEADSVLRIFLRGPVRMVLMTHYHDDHLEGVPYWKRKGARVAAHANVERQARRDTVIDEWIARHRTAAAPETMPTDAFLDSLLVTAGRDSILAIHVPDAHTDGDAIIWLPRRNVIHTGDIFEHGAPPFIDWWAGGSVAGMLAGVDRVLALADDRTIIIPGHGAPARRAELVAYRAMLATVAARVDSLVRLGRDAAQAIAEHPAADFSPLLGSARRQDKFVELLWVGANHERQRRERAAAAVKPAGRPATPAPAPRQAAATPVMRAPSRPTFRRERLADGVWLFAPVEPTSFGGDPNSVAIVGPTDVVLVDANFSEAATRALLASLREVTRLPVRWVVNTHWHDDHVTGNAAIAKAFPGATFVGHRFMREDMLAQGVANRTAFVRAIPNSTRRLRDLAARGMGLDGQPTDATEAGAIAFYADLLDRFAAESASFVRTPPTVTFDDRMTIVQGARRIDLLYLGKGHTRGDAVVYLPDDGLVVAGDLLIEPVPFIGTTSFPREYGATLERLLALPHRTIVPGHGRVLRDDLFAADVRRLLESIRAQVDSGVARGDSLPAVQRGVDLDEFRRRFAGDDRLRNALFTTYVVQSAIPKAYRDAMEEKSARQPR